MCLLVLTVGHASWARKRLGSYRRPGALCLLCGVDRYEISSCSEQLRHELIDLGYGQHRRSLGLAFRHGVVGMDHPHRAPDLSFLVFGGASGRIRTCGQDLRRILLYPLSYRGEARPAETGRGVGR